MLELYIVMMELSNMRKNKETAKCKKKKPLNVTKIRSYVIFVLPNVTMEQSNMKKENQDTTKCDKSTVKSDVGPAQCKNRTVKCEKNNKGTNECDKRTVTCDVETAQCEDGTVKCEKKKNKGTTECDKRTVICDWNCIM